MVEVGPLAAGTLIGGDFRILEPLSAGGMGAVYVAEQISTGKRRALKVMHPALVRDPKSQRRFVDEARAGAQIDSDHVVEVIGAGVDTATGAPWLAMELLEGENLEDHVRRAGPMSLSALLDVFEPLAHALGRAHERGIIHRDLKPENLFLARARRLGAPPMLKILDFGIASFAGDATAATVTTAIGSPFWIAPEQTSTGARLRPSTDVWALGLIAFYLLTGRRYWLAANAAELNLSALLAEILVHPLVPASQRARELGATPTLPERFDAWFAQCVQREPSARPANATAAVSGLRALRAPTSNARIEDRPHVALAEAPTAPSPDALPRTPPTEPMPGVSDDRTPENRAPTRRPARRWGWALAGVAALVAVACVALGVASRFTEEGPSVSPYSEQLVGALEHDLEIVAYFTSGLPPPFDATERDVRALLSAYERAGDGRVHVRWVDAREAAGQRAAIAAGIPAVAHQLVADGGGDPIVGHRGLVLRYEGEDATLPVIGESRGLEYDISIRIRSLVHGARAVGIATGHGSPAFEALSTLRSWSAYRFVPVDLAAIDPELDAVLVIEPTESLSDTELRQLDAYVMQGGSLGIFGGAMRTQIDSSPPSGSPADTHLGPLFERWGLSMGDAFVADTRCGRVPLRTSIGIQIPVAYPPAPILELDDVQRAHPVGWQLESVPFFFASPIQLVRAPPAGVRRVILGRTSAESWLLRGEPIDLAPRDPRQWTRGEDARAYTVLVALSGPLPSAFGAATASPDARVLVAGTGSFLRNEYLPSPEAEGHQGAFALQRNVLEWLAEDPALVAIRAR